MTTTTPPELVAAAVKRKRRTPKSRRPIDQFTAGEKVFNVFNVVLMLLMAFVCFYPFWYIFVNTISDNTLSAAGDILFVPRGLHIQNYVTIFKIPGIAHAAWISVLRTVLGTLLTVAVSAYLGFMMTQRKMAFRSGVYRFLVATMYINAGLIPIYILFNYLGLLDNFLVYILPFAVSAFNVVLVKTFIESAIPGSLQEAAEIDGAGTWTIFTRVILPLTGPILATLAIFSAVGQWNSFMDTVIFVTSEDLQTLQYVLYRFLSQAQAMANIMAQGGVVDPGKSGSGVTTVSIRYTITMITVLPIFIVYPFMQKYFAKGITVGAVKG
ncbi:MAG TPA: carbohydrate ABC transporter permease [Arachnia sp.]|nr:carbohydrate ABC transporter permease [Arachnia sp.]HMT87113.1 carbohydrate ABC transporter permease [Arachnia sp.]